MNKLTIAGFVLLLLAFQKAVIADSNIEDSTGNSIISGCATNSIQDYAHQDLLTNNHSWECIGAVVTANDIMQHFEMFCPPSGVTVGQQLRVVYDFMESHPDKLNLPFSTLIYAALQHAWPCNKN